MAAAEEIGSDSTVAADEALARRLQAEEQQIAARDWEVQASAHAAAAAAMAATEEMEIDSDSTVAASESLARRLQAEEEERIAARYRARELAATDEVYAHKLASEEEAREWLRREREAEAERRRLCELEGEAEARRLMAEEEREAAERSSRSAEIRQSEALDLALCLHRNLDDGGGAETRMTQPGLSYASVLGEVGGSRNGSQGSSLAESGAKSRAESRAGSNAATPTPTQRRGVPSAPRPARISLIFDGANLGCEFAKNTRAHGDFCAEGIRSAMLYFERVHGVPRREMVVVVHERRMDWDDGVLSWLAEEERLALTPPGKDDDLFAIQLALDHGSWIVTRDRFLDHNAQRWMNEALKKRLITYSWAGSTFAPPADVIERFLRARRGLS